MSTQISIVQDMTQIKHAVVSVYPPCPLTLLYTY